MRPCPPVLLLIYDRPALTREVWARIRDARPEQLLIVADGPRSTVAGDAEKCAQARAVTDDVDWPCRVLREYADVNLGLRQRVSTGISWALLQVEEAIILEDDCVPHPSFFGFCAELLERYREDPRIISISGDNYQQGRRRGTGSYYFSKYPTCWGWATWRRAWALFDVDMTTWPAFRDEGALQLVCPDADEHDYWQRCFEETQGGKNQSWAYAWVYAAFCNGALSVHPNSNLISNIGFGDDATHTSTTHSFGALPTDDLGVIEHPQFALADRDADRTEFEGTHLQFAPSPASGTATRLRAGALAAARAVKSQRLRGVVRALLPPLLLRTLRRPPQVMPDASRATGDYATWEAALRDSNGYDAPVILERTRAALAQVRDGHAAYERDSVLFHEPDYPFPLLTCLLRAAVDNGNALHVLDFGGALGTSYYQCRSFLDGLEHVRWSVVDQPAHVACGRAEFASDVLRFHESVEECVREDRPQVLLLSGVAQYLPAPHAFLESVLEHPFSHVIVDRTPFMRDGRERLTVQTVPAVIYPASMPLWFLSEARFKRAFEGRYELAASFRALDTLQPDGGAADHKGFFFRRRPMAAGSS